jgi:hypothetical protein
MSPVEYVVGFVAIIVGIAIADIAGACTGCFAPAAGCAGIGIPCLRLFC